MPGSSTNGPVAGVALRPGRLAPPARLRLRTIGLALAVVVLVMTTAPAAQAAALHRAVKAGDLNGMTRMLAAGTDVNARDNRGRTALMYAVDKRYLLLVEPLLAAQADPNVRALDGATALFMAAVHGYGEIITLLMQAGADPTIEGPQLKGIKGRTATAVARTHYGDPETARAQGERAEIIALLEGKMWEDVVFARADSLWTVDAYADYIASYPSGRHVEKARRRQAALERAPLLTATSPAGTTLRECDVCPEMVVIPAGRFRMGDLDGGGDRDERPVHDVTIATPFAVGKYEVTFAEWDACVTAGGCTHRPGDAGWGRGKRPVINVSWDDAQEYVQWLSREVVGKPYRLLSEAEWEYVARAGTKTVYWWGGDSWLDDSPSDYANHRGTDGADRWVSTAPVGSFKANPFGVFDTAGNVLEWVEDCQNYSYRGAPNDGSAWESGDCYFRMLRGGALVYDPEDLRSAERYGSTHGDRSYYIGFRLARTLTP